MGSKSGIAAITRTAPVCGSIATTDPGSPGERVDRRPLRLRVERRDEVVALALLAAQLVEDRRELVRLAGQVVVV